MHKRLTSTTATMLCIIPKEEASIFHHAASYGNLKLIREFIEVRKLSVDETDKVRTNCI